MGGRRGPPLVITEVWSTPLLGITVMPRGVGVPGGALPLGLLERDIRPYINLTMLHDCIRYTKLN